MPIFKSHKVIFFTKLVLLISLSFVMVAFAAIMGTGGGHGNYFPVVLIFGPAWILSALPVPPHMEHIYLICGVICLYVTYALLLKFVKSEKTFSVIFISHIVISFIIMLLGDIGVPELFVNDAGAIPFVLPMNAITFTLWALVIWLLKSIHKNQRVVSG